MFYNLNATIKKINEEYDSNVDDYDMLFYIKGNNLRLLWDIPPAPLPPAPRLNS